MQKIYRQPLTKITCQLSRKAKVKAKNFRFKAEAEQHWP